MDQLPKDITLQMARDFLDDFDVSLWIRCSHDSLARMRDYRFKRSIGQTQLKEIAAQESVVPSPRPFQYGVIEHIYIYPALLSRGETLVSIMSVMPQSTQNFSMESRRPYHITKEMSLPERLQSCLLEGPAVIEAGFVFPNTLNALHVRDKEATISPEVMLPASLRHFKLLAPEIIVKPLLERNTLPNLTDLHLNEWNASDLALLPSSLEQLIIASFSVSPGEDVVWPRDLTSLDVYLHTTATTDLHRWRLPERLESLYLCSKMAVSVEGFTLPASLTMLSMPLVAVTGGKLIDALMLPDGLKSLSLPNGSTNSSLRLPSSLEDVSLGLVQQPLYDMRHCTNIRTISITAAESQRATRHFLPPRLENILFFRLSGDVALLPMRDWNGLLPSTLRTMKLMNHADFTDAQLPPGLTELTAAGKPTNVFASAEWPKTLTRIHVLEGAIDFRGMERHGTSNLRELDLSRTHDTVGEPNFAVFQHLEILRLPLRGGRMRLEYPGFFPPTLHTLHITRNFSPPVVPWIFPSTLREFHLSGAWGQPWSTMHLPDKLEVLRIDYAGPHPMHDLELPDTLLSLHFGGQFDQPLDQVTLPPNLRFLSIRCSYYQWTPERLPKVYPSSLRLVEVPLGYRRLWMRLNLPAECAIKFV